MGVEYDSTTMISHYRKRKQGRTVDALALGGDEGRGKLREGSGRCKRPVIRTFPNGVTHLVEDQVLREA